MKNRNCPNKDACWDYNASNCEACALGEKFSRLTRQIKKLKAENAALRERLEKAVEEVDKVKKIIEPTMYTSFCGFVVRWCTLMEHKELYGTQEAAEARLKKIKENNDDVRRI